MSNWESWLLALIPSAMTSLAILGVGYWVNTTIRKKNHRDALVYGYLQELIRQIQKLTTDAVDARTLECCTLSLRRLSNEVQHLIDLHDQFAAQSTNPRKVLDVFVFELKWFLTESGTPAEDERRECAQQAVNKLRNEVLQVVLTICDRS